MKNVDIILVDKDDLRKAIAILEEVGIETSMFTPRMSIPSCCQSHSKVIRTRSMTSEDPYADFRDNKGRFKKGNPGGTGGLREGAGRFYGSFTWLNEWEFREKHRFLIVSYPNSCPQCKLNDYRFDLRMDAKNTHIIRCKCNSCNYERQYLPFSKAWSTPQSVDYLVVI